MQHAFDYGDEVRVTRNVRNDGTFPGRETGELLIRRGSSGFVRNIGTFLQDQIIYTVHFIEQDLMVGCREEELLSIDEQWVPSVYEFRDKVSCTTPLAINGEVIIEPGQEGEVIKVLRDHPGGVAYHVRFPGRTLLVPESVLTPFEHEKRHDPEQTS